MTRKLWIKTIVLLFTAISVVNLPQLVFAGDDDTDASGNFFVNLLGCKAGGGGEIDQ